MSRIKFEDFYEILQNRVNHSLTSKEISRYTYEEGIACLFLSNDDQNVFMGSIDGSILAFNLAKKELTSLYKLSGSDTDITAMAGTKDDKYIIFGSSNGSIGIFDWNQKEMKKLFDKLNKDAVSCLMATDDGEYFVSGCRDGSISVFDIETENLMGSIENAHQGNEMI